MLLLTLLACCLALVSQQSFHMNKALGCVQNPLSLLPVETDTRGWERPKGSVAFQGAGGRWVLGPDLKQVCEHKKKPETCIEAYPP